MIKLEMLLVDCCDFSKAYLRSEANCVRSELIKQNCATLRLVHVPIALPVPDEGKEYQVLEKLTCEELTDDVRRRCPVLKESEEISDGFCLKCLTEDFIFSMLS